MTQTVQSLMLDLPDTLACEAELLPHLIESARVTVLESEAELNHPFLPGGELIKRLVELLLEKLLRGHLRRRWT